jgi:hypothetical protein
MTWIKKQALLEVSKSRPEGYLEDLYQFVVSETQTHIEISDADYLKLVDKYSPKKVGTEIAKMLSWFPVSKCGRCAKLEARFNRWGPDRCEKNIDRIVKYLRISARRKKIPTTDTLLKILVRKAIRNARR